MIEASHVGVGVEGLEGKQAVMASDYSIAQFRFLRRLLLIHGGWSYRRLSVLIMYCFYKNIAIALVQLWFGFWCGLSGQIFYDQVSASMYNILFTGLPVLLLAVFNRDISEKVLLRYPKLYSAGMRNEYFNFRRFSLAMLKGVVDSLLLFFVVVWSLRGSTTSGEGDEAGQVNDHWTLSTALFTMGVIVVNVKVSLETRTWTKWNAIGLFWTLLGWWVWAFIITSSQAFNPDLYGIMARLVTMPNFWLLIPIMVMLTAVPDVAIR